MPYRFECGKLRPWVYYCLFGLLSVSGLRLGEARNLELQDVDLKAAVLTIRGAKFGKTRLVPLHASTCTVLADYIVRRQRHWAGRAVSSYARAASQFLVKNLRQLGEFFGKIAASFTDAEKPGWKAKSGSRPLGLTGVPGVAQGVAIASANPHSSFCALEGLEPATL
jgi:hypothetical protein